MYEKPHGSSKGYVPVDGDGSNGVLIVAEAAGEFEAAVGKPLVGKSGYALFQQLDRVGIQREGFLIHNVLSCRPPDNKFDLPYIPLAVQHCSPNLDRSIDLIKKIAKTNGKTPVIVTLGVQPFKRVLGLDSRRDSELLKKDVYAYPFWSDRYSCWVLNAPHPAYLVRGKTQYWPLVQFVFQRALEIAKDGLKLDHHDYLLDPDVHLFMGWVEGYLRSLDDRPDNVLSYDIETPYKKKKGEDELTTDEDGNHIILRISFAYEDERGHIHTTSIPWSAEYMSGIEILFARAPYVLGWNSDEYDHPRVSQYVNINGIGLDGMVAWHILNTSLDKGLGFVTPFYWHKTTMWKHLNEDQPAFYNAKDSDAALRNFIGIKKDLIKHKLWHVYERHWIELNKALRYMSGKGVLRDNEMRSAAEAQLSERLAGIESQMAAAVPQEVRQLKVYKKTPKDTTGLIQTVGKVKVKACPKCGAQSVKANHFKSIGKKRLKSGETENSCHGLKPVAMEVDSSLWAQPLEFKISKKGMSNYQDFLKHQAIKTRKEKKVTYNADAIELLVKKYPNDPLYPLILDHRKVGKLLSTYIGVTDETGRMSGGMPVGRDGRIHTVYSRHASTLRYTSRDPNLQNLPRPNPKDPSDPANIIRNLVVAEPNSVLYARDFSGIEAVLTGYFSLDPKYIRLAKRDIHTYYTVYALYELEGGKRIGAADLPDIDWPDDRLFPYLEHLKDRFKFERNNLYKHLVHAANFMQGAMGAKDKIFSETGIEYPVRTVQRVMDVYYNLFPKIKVWHKTTLDEAEKDTFLRNPFGYVHRFNRVYDYRKECGQWVKKPGADSNKAIAFKPQSTAVALITEAILRLYYDYFEEAGQYLRLQVHDELLFEVPTIKWETLDQIVLREMERPSPNMPLPASWNMGTHLNILTEAKVGLDQPSRWGSMKGFHDKARPTYD